MKRYFCDICKRELLVKSFSFRFSIRQIFVGTSQPTGLISELNRENNRTEEICEACAVDIRKRMKGL